MYMSTQNICLLATFLIETESRNTKTNSQQNMAVMVSDSPSPHSPSLRLGLPDPQPSRRHHAQSLLGPSFHDPRTHHSRIPPRHQEITCVILCRLILNEIIIHIKFLNIIIIFLKIV